MAVLARAPRAERMRLAPNRPRLLESILYLLSEAERRNTYLTQYEIVKALFVADTSHLNNHGRPVTFDNYVAMENGPVASEAYDMLKPDYNWRATLNLDEAPWTRVLSPADGAKSYRYVRQREPNTRKISRTDMEALGEGITLVKAKGFRGVKDWTHRHRAYEAAWREGEGKAFDMDYRLLLDHDDPELLEEIAEASRHI